MNKILFVLALLLASCLSCTTSMNSWRKIEWTDTDHPGQAKAIEIARTHAEEYLGKSLDHVAPIIFWTESKCPLEEFPQGKNAVVYRKKCESDEDLVCAFGATFTCSEIYVSKQGSIAKSALVHELFHCFYLAEFNMLDRDHLDESWWGRSMVANEEVRKRGL